MNAPAKKPTDYVLVKRSVVADTIKKQIVSAYTIQFMSFILYARNINLTLTTLDVCDILKLNRKTFERYRKRSNVRYTMYGDQKMYSLFDMVKVAEAMTRSKRNRQINSIPTAFCKKDKSNEKAATGLPFH